MAWFPRRLQALTLVSGSSLNPVLTDDFILVPNPGTCDPGKEYQVVFKARPKTGPESQ